MHSLHLKRLMIHGFCRHYCFLTKNADYEFRPCQEQRRDIFLSAAKYSVLFWKVATSCRCIWTIISSILVSGQRPAPPWSRLARSSEKRNGLQSEFLAKAAAAVGTVAVPGPLWSPLCWCHLTEMRKRPERKAAQQSGCSKLCFDQSLESSSASGLKQEGGGPEVLQDRKLIRLGWN